MQPQLLPGLSLIFFAAACGGAFAFPLRIRRRYAVENTMLIAMGFATIIIPTIVVSAILPTWPKALADASPLILLIVAFGFGWGCGSATFAMGIAALGLGLGFALIMGLNTVVGSVIPMMTNWSSIPPLAKVITVIGIAVCVVGVGLIGKSGALREKADQSKTSVDKQGTKTSSFVIGLVWCILSGLLSACANLGFHFGEPLGKAAANMGVSPLFATLLRWIPMYWGGYLAILMFMGATLVKNRTYVNYVGPSAGRDFMLAIAMGSLHFLAQIPYGMGTYYLGSELGTTIGWVINISSSIIVANLLGNFTGEWKKAPRQAIQWRNSGLAVLIAAMCILAFANSISAV